MNACGQHNIGFQGMSINPTGSLVWQVLFGGGNLGDGKDVFLIKLLRSKS
jgi:hypothetical protein